MSGPRARVSKAIRRIGKTLLHHPYRYQPLPPGKGVTRVIWLQPAKNPKDKLVCRLETLSYLESQNRFEAISYAWGAPIFSELLLCEDGSSRNYLWITQNLSDALRQFRLPNRPRALWADAVCINQGDDQEKSMQVAQMGKVFAAADTVLVWLGLPDQYTADAFDFCHVLARSAPACGLEPSDIYLEESINWTSPSAEEKRFSFMDSAHYEAGLALWKTINRPWFIRR